MAATVTPIRILIILPNGLKRNGILITDNKPIITGNVKSITKRSGTCVIWNFAKNLTIEQLIKYEIKKAISINTTKNFPPLIKNVGFANANPNGKTPTKNTGSGRKDVISIANVIFSIVGFKISIM